MSSFDSELSTTEDSTDTIVLLQPSLISSISHTLTLLLNHNITQPNYSKLLLLQSLSLQRLANSPNPNRDLPRADLPILKMRGVLPGRLPNIPRPHLLSWEGPANPVQHPPHSIHKCISSD